MEDYGQSDLRDLLASAYALADDENGSPTQAESETIAARHAPVADTINDKTSMDSKAFDLGHWMHSRKNLSLDNNLFEHDRLVAEINKLQSQMQTLVYDNYSRFIDATDIIHNMRNDFKGMAKDTSELQKNMTVVAQQSETVNGNLQVQRANLTDLNQLQSVLRNLQAALKLPQELQASVDAGDLTSAVELYSRALTLLNKYGHRGILRDVKRESDAIAKMVKNQLLERLEDSGLTTAEALSAVQTLIILNVGPDVLRTRFLAGQRRQLDTVLQEVAKVVACMEYRSQQKVLGSENTSDAGPELPPSWAGEHGELPSLETFIVELDKRLVTALCNVVSMYNTIFCSGPAAPKTRTMDKHVKSLAQEFVRAYVAHIKRAIAYCGMAAALGASAVKGKQALLEGSNAAYLREAFQEDWGIGTLTHSIDEIKASLSRASAVMPELVLQDKSSEVVEGAIRHQVGAAFAALEQLVISQVSSVSQSLQKSPATPAQLNMCLANLLRTLMTGCDSLFKTFKTLADNDELLKGWQDVFVDLLQAQLQHLFLSLISHFHVMTGTLQSDGSTSIRRVGASFKFANEAPSNPLFPATPTKAAQSAFLGTAPAASPTSPGSAGGLSSPPTPSTLHAAPQSEQASPVLVLLLACFCKEMKDKAVAGALEAVAKYVPSRGGGGSTGLSPPAFVAAEVQRRLSRAVTALLTTFVHRHAAVATAHVTQAMTDSAWLQAERPAGPRAFVAVLQADLQATATEAATLLPRGEPLPPAFLPPHAQLARHSRHSSGIDIDDQMSEVRAGVGLFQERGKLELDAVEGSVHSVVMTLAMLMLQKMLECVRLQDLTPPALHQLQVDIAHLRQVFSHVKLRPFIDDILSAGLDRCEQPVLMDQASIDALLKLLA